MALLGIFLLACFGEGLHGVEEGLVLLGECMKGCDDHGDLICTG